MPLAGISTFEHIEITFYNDFELRCLTSCSSLQSASYGARCKTSRHELKTNRWSFKTNDKNTMTPTCGSLRWPTRNRLMVPDMLTWSNLRGHSAGKLWLFETYLVSMWSLTNACMAAAAWTLMTTGGLWKRGQVLGPQRPLWPQPWTSDVMANMLTVALKAVLLAMAEGRHTSKTTSLAWHQRWLPPSLPLSCLNAGSMPLRWMNNVLCKGSWSSSTPTPKWMLSEQCSDFIATWATRALKLWLSSLKADRPVRPSWKPQESTNV